MGWTMDLLSLGGLVLGGLIAVLVLLGLFSGKKENRHVQLVQCSVCGWKGSVSRYAGRCPSCNNSLGERRAGR